MDTLLILKFVIALAIGALVGLERERKRKETEFAGIRTFIFIALLGILSGYLSQPFPYFFLIAFASLSFLVGLIYWVITRGNGDVGLTTELVALLTFSLGLMCYWGEGYKIAPILAIIITTFLALKPVLHTLARKISQKEMPVL